MSVILSGPANAAKFCALFNNTALAQFLLGKFNAQVWGVRSVEAAVRMRNWMTSCWDKLGYEPHTSILSGL